MAITPTGIVDTSSVAPRANPAGQSGRAEARISRRGTQIPVVAQVRGVANLPHRGHVIALSHKPKALRRRCVKVCVT